MNAMARQRVYQRAMNDARRMVQDKDQLSNLIKKATRKASDVGGQQKNQILEEVKLFVRMVRSYIKGQYPYLSPWTLLMVVFGLVYFVMPVDMIPDLLPAMGFTDDLAVLLMIFKRFSTDIDRFRQWEQSQHC